MRRLLTFLAIAVVLATGLRFTSTLGAISNSIVISQVYGGGGNAGSAFKNDFVELFNRGTTTVNVTGWSVQYASAGGNFSGSTTLSGSIPPGGYYLVQESQGTGGTTNLPTPDATGTIAMSATVGKVALVSNATLLSGTGCPFGATVVDYIGYGVGTTGANCFEGAAAAPTLTNTTADLRGGSGCTETDSNSTDFQSGAPNPRNSAAPANSCGQTNPAGTGSASPSSAAVGTQTTLSVAVTPGTSPASSGLAVTADLSSIGGSATQAFFDNGTNGDTTSGDNKFSFQVTVSGATSIGTKSIPASITDAQGRTANTTISLTVTAAAPLSGVGAASPAAVQAGNATLLTVTVTPATSPASTGITVNADLSSIGGSAVQAFLDNGTNGDVTAGDHVFSFLATIPPDAGSGARTLPFAIADAQGGSASGGIGLTVNGSTPPSATGSAVPASVPAGGTIQLTVTVTPGTNPASTGLSVTGDLSSIGGSNTQVFQSAGNTFSFSAAVDAATAQGAKTLPITVRDTQGRSGGFTIPLTVTAPLANSTIVISQIYAGGGNITTASYTNDFVQLYNRGSATVDLTGWSLQYAAATGTGDWSGRQPLGGTIAPGQYYLIAMAAGADATSALPPANVTSQINMGQGAGKVAITDSGDLLTGAGGCPDFTHVRDLVGYGSTANCFEGTGPAAVPASLTTTALFRQSGRIIDTNDNKNDFFVAGPPNPLSTTPIVTLPPAVFATYPTTNGVDIPRDATIEVTFTEAVTVDPSWFDINCGTTGAHDDVTEAPDGINRWITPNSNFVAGELCTVTVFQAKVHDADTGALSPPHDYTWTFTVASGAAPPETPDVHLLMGNPSNAVADVSQPNNYLMSKPEYALSYNRDLGRPNWVSWHLSSPWIPVNHGARVDTFRPDPQVPPDWYRVQSFDFSGSGFDRGHMDPNADRESSTPVNQATFLMSNMVAQSHDNNAGPWEDFENYLRSVVQGDPNNLNEVYIVSGPLGTGGTGTSGAATTTAGGHVTIPAYTWKVALVLPDNGSEDDISRVNCSTRTIAVVTPNIVGIISNPWEMYETTVADVESKTGYHFFTNLPQPIQNCIKAGTNGVNPKNDQTITFGPLADQPFGGDVALQASASSGLTVALAVTSGPATIVNGTTLHITAPGTVTIQATQAGDVNYNAAPPITQSFTVTPGSQTITFDAPAPAPTYGDPAFQLSAIGGPSGNPVTFAASGGCTASSQPGVATVTIVSAGVCTVTASQGGNADYNAAPQVAEAITIAKATPAFTGLTSPTVEAGTATTTLGGSIAAGALIPTGAIAVTLNGVTQTAAIQANGSFASAFATSVLAPAATPYAIAFTYAGDSNFNGVGGTAAVTVVDTTPPAIDAHVNLTMEATSASGAAVSYSAPATHDVVSGDGVANCSPVSTSTFPIGTTTVTCTAIDTHNNTASSSFTITIADRTAPALTLPANIITEATGPLTAVSFSATANDLVDGARPVTCTPSLSGFPVGTTPISCTASDAHGNVASGSFTVTITDHTPPAITVPANIAATATTPSGATVTFGATATDLVDGVQPAICTPASGATFAIGTTTVSCAASDLHGNSASRSFTVTVTTALVPGTMTGDAAVTSGTTTTTLQFAVLEGARGADAGFLVYDVKSRQSGRTQENVFISALVTNVSFFNVPGVSPGKRPASGVDTVSFSGTGLWNGRAGYTFTATAVDAGEPGAGRDTFAITIADSTGQVVASLNATITSGNIQSLRAF